MTTVSDHRSFLSDVLTRQYDRRRLIDPGYDFPPQPDITGYDPPASATAGPSKRHVINYIEEEETVRNDLSGRYVQSGEFGSNYILGAADDEICEEYPALRRLMDLKAQHVEQHSHPPLRLTLPSSSAGDITSSLANNRFDVILLRPLDTWAETAEIPIRNISADPGFVFLWVGKGDDEGLERGRECFAKWGFRRAEDIVWVKTNRARRHSNGGSEVDASHGIGGEGLFASSKEHCLMGIRGTVRRSTDSRFVHCNVDTDIIVYEGEDSDESGSAFPPYLYTLIENFCLGARRLELFVNPIQSRRGWVTASLYPSPPSQPPIPDVGIASTFDPTAYPSLLPRDEARPVLPFNPEIDQLRPKSPVRRGGPSGGPPRNMSLPSNSNLPPRPPRHQHQTHSQPQIQAMDPMAMQMQMQLQMQLHMQQMQQAQMMAAMGMGMGMNMMDPMMLAQAQAQAQAQAMQMQMQQGYGGQGQVGYGQGQGMMYNPYEGHYGQITYPGGQQEQGQGQGQYGVGGHPAPGGPGWGWQQQQ